MTFHNITIFPESLNSYINESILGRAIKKRLVKVKFYNPRDFSKNKHRNIDSKPYGGGPGMVIEAEPIIKAVERARGRKKRVKIILFTPHGKKFTNKKARDLTRYKDIILISGRYEGIDERVRKILKPDEISIGDYVLTGGELPAMVVMDAVARQIKGVLGKEESVEERRVAGKEVYGRPAEFKYKGKKYKVPKVLLSGHHEKIQKFRKK